MDLGIKRDRMGDIHVHDEFAHCLMAEEIADYINIHLRQVHRANVFTDIIPLNSLQTAVSAGGNELISSFYASGWNCQ